MKYREGKGYQRNTNNKMCPGSNKGASERVNGKCPYCKKPVGISNSDIAAGGRDKGTVGDYRTTVIQIHYA